MAKAILVHSSISMVSLSSHASPLACILLAEVGGPRLAGSEEEVAKVWFASLRFNFLPGNARTRPKNISAGAMGQSSQQSRESPQASDQDSPQLRFGRGTLGKSSCHFGPWNPPGVDCLRPAGARRHIDTSANNLLLPHLKSTLRSLDLAEPATSNPEYNGTFAKALWTLVREGHDNVAKQSAGVDRL